MHATCRDLLYSHLQAGVAAIYTLQPCRRQTPRAPSCAGHFVYSYLAHVEFLGTANFKACDNNNNKNNNNNNTPTRNTASLDFEAWLWILSDAPEQQKGGIWFWASKPTGAGLPGNARAEPARYLSLIPECKLQAALLTSCKFTVS